MAEDSYRIEQLEKWRLQVESIVPTFAVVVERLEKLSNRVDTLIRVFVALLLALFALIGGIVSGLVVLLLTGHHAAG